jgi:UDP-2,3-diacylglucosamine hydrolase
LSRPTLFISDLHLRPEAPRLTEILFDLLRGPAAGAAALYVLGDLFEAWPGDDDADDPFNAPVIAAFRSLSESGIPLHFQHGNRDFMLGNAFAAATGGTLLPEEIVVDCTARRRCCCTATSYAPTTSRTSSSGRRCAIRHGSR